MKRAIAITTIIVMLAMAMSGCTGPGKKPDDGRFGIYASFYPMYFIAGEIAGEKAAVKVMVPAGAEPHDWEPTPKFAAELKAADIIVYNGTGMETWMEKILPVIEGGDTRLVDASRGIELLESEEHEEAEGQDEPEEHEHGLYDPHVWVSPMRLLQQAGNVYEAIVEADPQNEEYYEANMKELTTRLEKLDRDIRETSKSFRSNVIVVSHEAFGYFAEDYGLRQVAIRGINPQDEPSLSKMAELAEICRENNVRYVFFEKLTGPELSEALAGEVGAGTLVLNDAAGISEEDIKAGKDYITVMYENLDNLKKALGD
ncbi:MAG TPA: zinc ABC transporter substrate-binding protein [Clostridia bacterium]|nr:zinc ABC transporter substrate-binding protein [Clostridia bacterium]